MMRGQDESDEILVFWTKKTTELPHFSFSLEAWRGFRDLGAVWSELGAAHGRPDLAAAGRELEAEAPLLKRDVTEAMLKSVVNATGTTGAGVCHPYAITKKRSGNIFRVGIFLDFVRLTTRAPHVGPQHVRRAKRSRIDRRSRITLPLSFRYVAGEGACGDMDLAGAHVSGTAGPYNARASEPWRSYSGMFWSGGLDSSTAAEIVDYNQHNEQLARMGVWSAGKGFRNMFMGFTEQGHGYGLLQHNMIKPFLLQLYTEMGHVCTRGSWTCFESRGLPNFTPAGGYATPAQLVVPLHTKWLLLWTDPASGALTLCRGTPRSWLDHGETIAVKRAPTTGGRVAFEVVSRLGDEAPTIAATVTVAMDSRPARANARTTAPPVSLTLTLRAPAGHHLESVTVDGKSWSRFDAAAETVELPALAAPASGKKRQYS